MSKTWVRIPPVAPMKVNETRKRSLLKAISFRVIEVGIDTWILSYFIDDNRIAFGLAVAIELLCMGLHFVFERVWNRIDYGRHIIKD